MSIQEKKHRLPKEYYKGQVSVAFTLCLKGNENKTSGFTDPVIVNVFTDILAKVVAKQDCIVPVYCYMPDHQHLIITGTARSSDISKAIANYKQKTGYWMSANRSILRWQKDFYDHVIRKHEDLSTQARYILDNPVRKGFVSSWQEYSFIGSIGCRLEDVLEGII